MNLQKVMSLFPNKKEAQAAAELFYSEVLRVRLVEETLAERYSEQEMRCPMHLSTGQEAAAVGACQALERTDKIFSTHRSHAHYLAKGGDLRSMLSEIYGKASGCAGGRGGSMHLMDPDAGVEVAIPIVASSIPIAAGYAFAEKRRGGKGICVSFFGDACVEEGVFHETANFAAQAKLPLLLLCENNLYSVYTPLHERQPERPLCDVAKAHGIPSWEADGNDVFASYATCREAVTYIRDGNGPAFVSLNTYRWREHCGPNFDNHAGYRTLEEFNDWQERCPVKLMEEMFDREGGLSKERREEISETLNVEISQAFEFARSAPLPELNDASRYVYAECST